MPIDLQIIRASEFVRLATPELLDFAASKAALELLARACRKRGVDRALLDLRALPMPAKPLFKPTQLAALVETFREAGFARQQRLAVLYKSDPHYGVRMFAFIGALKGWQVRAFEDFEQALHWLSEEKGRKGQPGEKEVPVQLAHRQIEVKESQRSMRKKSSLPATRL